MKVTYISEKAIKELIKKYEMLLSLSQAHSRKHPHMSNIVEETIYETIIDDLTNLLKQNQ